METSLFNNISNRSDATIARVIFLEMLRKISNDDSKENSFLKVIIESTFKSCDIDTLPGHVIRKHVKKIMYLKELISDDGGFDVIPIFIDIINQVISKIKNTSPSNFAYPRLANTIHFIIPTINNMLHKLKNLQSTRLDKLVTLSNIIDENKALDKLITDVKSPNGTTIIVNAIIGCILTVGAHYAIDLIIKSNDEKENIDESISICDSSDLGNISWGFGCKRKMDGEIRKDKNKFPKISSNTELQNQTMDEPAKIGIQSVQKGLENRDTTNEKENESDIDETFIVTSRELMKEKSDYNILQERKEESFFQKNFEEMEKKSTTIEKVMDKAWEKRRENDKKIIEIKERVEKEKKEEYGEKCESNVEEDKKCESNTDVNDYDENKQGDKEENEMKYVADDKEGDIIPYEWSDDEEYLSGSAIDTNNIMSFEKGEEEEDDNELSDDEEEYLPLSPKDEEEDDNEYSDDEKNSFGLAANAKNMILSSEEQEEEEEDGE